MDKPLSPDAKYVVDTLFPELRDNFRQWSQEYQQERDLGSIGEFVGLYRKARKLKTVFIDKVDPSNWRESVRTIALEVAAHALLLVRDLDLEGNNCPRECSEGHTYELGCTLVRGINRPHEPGPLCDERCGHDGLIGRPRG